jgi:DNA invertase Pin-like site-specific DNA recombinase
MALKKQVKHAETQKVAIYIRVSTRWQVDKASLPVQRDELINYAKYVLSITDYDIFEDAGFSAKNTDRPAYQQMMSRIRMGEFSHILVWKIDRISRNLLDFTTMFNELKQLGVTFVSKNEQFDTSTPMGEAMLKIILVFAELERNMTSERVSAVMINMAHNGTWNGGRVPYGYSYDKDTKQFSINEAEAAVVKLIYYSYIEQQSTLQVSRMLNEKGLRSRNGNEWSAVTVHKIITNVFYKGDYRYNYRSENGSKRQWTIKYEAKWVITENHHVPIITKELWAEANNLLKRSDRGGYRQYDSYTRKNIHIFAGLLKCGYCGSNMVSNKDSKQIEGRRPSKYVCSLRHRSKDCPNKYTSDPVIGPFILAYISNMIQAANSFDDNTTEAALEKKLLEGKEFASVKHINEESLAQFAALIRANRSGVEYKPLAGSREVANLANERALLEKEKNTKECALVRLKTLYLYNNEEMSERDYVISKKEITDRLDFINKRLEELNTLEHSLESMNDKEFIELSSYFIVTQNLINRKVPFKSLINKIDEQTLKDFMRNIIKCIFIKDGRVISITFNNESTHKFIYK